MAWFKSSYSGNDPGSECVEIAYDWHKSSYSSNEGGNCVEVAATPHAVHVRDSKDSTGPILMFTADAWAVFVSSVAAEHHGS